MARKKNSKTADDLVADLNLWVSNHNLQSNRNIRQLIDDLSSRSNFSMWADIDPDKLVPIPELEMSNKAWRRINLLSTFRNIIVFSPVALTWASISIATSALAKFERENPDTVTNFLQFWQQGFGYLDSFWTLSNVALFDVGIVVVIILLTSIIGIMSKQAIEAAIIEQENINETRTNIILQLMLFFNEYKKPTISQINKNNYIASKELVYAVKNLKNIVKQLEKDIKKYPDNRRIIVEINKIEKAIKKNK